MSQEDIRNLEAARDRWLTSGAPGAAQMAEGFQKEIDKANARETEQKSLVNEKDYTYGNQGQDFANQEADYYRSLGNTAAHAKAQQADYGKANMYAAAGNEARGQQNYGLGKQDYGLGQQDAAMGLSRDAALGLAPSRAEILSRTNMDRAAAAQQSLAASARGPAGLAMAQQNAAAATADAQSRMAADAYAGRAGEMADARNAYGQQAAQYGNQAAQYGASAGNMRSGDLSAQQQEAAQQQYNASMRATQQSDNAKNQLAYEGMRGGVYGQNMQGSQNKSAQTNSNYWGEDSRSTQIQENRKNRDSSEKMGYVNAAGNAAGVVSDERVKENVRPLTAGDVAAMPLRKTWGTGDVDKSKLADIVVRPTSNEMPIGGHDGGVGAGSNILLGRMMGGAAYGIHAPDGPNSGPAQTRAAMNVAAKEAGVPATFGTKAEQAAAKVADAKPSKGDAFRAGASKALGAIGAGMQGFAAGGRSAASPGWQNTYHAPQYLSDVSTKNQLGPGDIAAMSLKAPALSKDPLMQEFNQRQQGMQASLAQGPAVQSSLDRPQSPMLLSDERAKRAAYNQGRLDGETSAERQLSKVVGGNKNMAALTNGARDEVPRLYGTPSKEEQASMTPSTTGDPMEDYLATTRPAVYEYKNPNMPGAAPGPQVGPASAQEMEKTAIGSTVVKTDPVTHLKMIDGGAATKATMSAVSHVNDKLNALTRVLSPVQGAAWLGEQTAKKLKQEEAARYAAEQAKLPRGQ